MAGEYEAAAFKLFDDLRFESFLDEGRVFSGSNERKVLRMLAAALRQVVVEEREKCARVADDWGPGLGENWENANSLVAAAIRARGKEK